MKSLRRSPRSVALALSQQRALRCASLALALACQSDGGADGPRRGLVGGWSNEAAHVFACFAQDGRMWIGDSLTEIGGTSHCTVDDASDEFHCSDPDGGSPFDGVLEVSGDELTLDVVPCPADPAECQATYVRDPSLTCD